MKTAYLLAGTELSVLWRLVRRNKAGFSPRYIPRLLFLLNAGMWSSLFSVIEKKRYGKHIAASPLPDNPIIIVGHWRTGSTWLHQLLSLDPSLVTPTLFQAALPRSFFSARLYFAPVMRFSIHKKRPMDNVKLGIDEPMEDEYALLRLCGFSPLEGLIFPQDTSYFLNDFPGFLPEQNISEWEKALNYFCRKLTFNNKQTLLLKNPFHSLRIQFLSEIFPKARFVHIYRSPYAVVPSTLNMWETVGQQNRMKCNHTPISMREVADMYQHLLTFIEQALNNIPLQRQYSIRYENLEKQPENTIRDMYRHFGMDFSDVFCKNIQQFLQENTNFNKNIFTPTPDDKAIIATVLADAIKKYDYAAN
ncbi:MAG: sulfotransferase [Lentimicrobiaceae bacterium]|jgi:hypothetical protein|nr:sulfotransferase [Lentimicrobiaceae bacterium]